MIGPLEVPFYMTVMQGNSNTGVERSTSYYKVTQSIPTLSTYMFLATVAVLPLVHECVWE